MSKHQNNRPTLRMPPPPPIAKAPAPDVDMTPAPMAEEDEVDYEEHERLAREVMQTQEAAAAAAAEALAAKQKAEAAADRAKNAHADTPAARWADIMEKCPLPWVVGPYGDIWVAGDVEQYDPETEAGFSKIPGPNGTFWRAVIERDPTALMPRLVMENPGEHGHRDAAAFIAWLTSKAKI